MRLLPLLLVILVAVPGCGGSGGSAEALSTTTPKFHEVTFQEMFKTQAERDGYHSGWDTCYAYAQRYDYTSLNDYLGERIDAAAHSVEAAEQQGCSDANSETPLKGSGIPTIPYDPDHP